MYINKYMKVVIYGYKWYTSNRLLILSQLDCIGLNLIFLGFIFWPCSFNLCRFNPDSSSDFDWSTPPLFLLLQLPAFFQEI